MEPLILFLVSILVFIVIAAIVLWLVRAIVEHLPIPVTARNIVLAVTALILLIIFLLFIQRQGWVTL